jgi:hypothetical protein
MRWIDSIGPAPDLYRRCIMSKTSKSKGLPSITIELDKPRTLRWPHGAVREFEDMALRYLELPKTGNVRADTILQQTLHNPTIQTFALYFGLREDARNAKELDFSMDKIDELLTTYKENGGNIDDLVEPIQRSFLISNDPSGLASWEERLKNLKEIVKLQKKIAAKEDAKKKTDLATSITNLEKQLAEIDSGPTPSDSASLSE